MGKWVLLGIGVLATIAAVIAAPLTCGASGAVAAIGVTLFKIAMGTMVGAAVSLAIGGTIAGIQSALTGHGFWEGFAESVQEEAVDALITSFAFTAITIAASNIMKCFQCFKEGTLVETEEGLKPIEDIQVGDKVLAYDEETGEQAYKPVVRLFRNETNEWYHIHVNGEEIVCTGGHPFYVASLDKFIPARELKVGNSLLLSGGTCVIIEEIQVEKLSRPQATYNFEVEDFHTYYVTDSKILVHNKCTNPGGRHGGDTHREKVKQIKDDLTEKGWTVSEKEVGIRTANGKLRYPDITATKDGVTRYYQIGRQTKMGRPIARELRALRDIGSTNTGKVFFIPYN